MSEGEIPSEETYPRIIPPERIEQLNQFAGTKIYKITIPQFPNLLFEYHPISRSLYLLEKGNPVAKCIAENVLNHGQAWNATLLFMRGYKHAIDGMSVIISG